MRASPTRRPVTSSAAGGGEAERAALAGRARDPDPPAVLGDDALADRQADAGARIRLLAVQALERLEDALGVLRLHPDPVVAHRYTQQ